jgi:hypothetical protein
MPSETTVSSSSRSIDLVVSHCGLARHIYKGHSWIFKPVNLTDFSQFSSISPGKNRNWVGFVFLSFPPHFTGSFGSLNTQKSPFSQPFHHFHTDNTHHFE